MKIGVIGTGHMGRNHVRALSEEGRFILAGIYDKDLSQAEEIAAQYGTRAFASLDSLLEQVEAVVVAVPSSLHKEIGLVVAEHNVHALIEKPLATNSKDAQDIADAFSERDLKLAVGHIERFNPVIQELDKLINNKQIFYIEAHRYSPFGGSGRIQDVSVIEDLMIHDIDLVCHMMEPYQVTAVHGLGEQIKSGCVDFASCSLDFNANAHAIINASRVSQEKERSICIHTADSCIYADLLLRSLTISQNTDMLLGGAHETSYRQNGVVQKIFVPIHEPLRLELISFYEAVTQNAPIAVTGEVGIRAIQICEEVSRCANTLGKRRA